MTTDQLERSERRRMRVNRGRRLAAGMLTTALVTVAMIAAWAAPAPAETTVSVKDQVITITMTVDVIGTDKHPTGPDGETIVDYWNQVLKDTWGAAFDRLPYKNCFKLELEVKLNERDADAKAREGNHAIQVGAESGGGFEGTGFEGAKEKSTNHRTGDGTRSFEHDRDGIIPSDAPPIVIAHEFGHLMGLGQDSKNGKPKPGREGTLMTGEEGLDPNQPFDPSMIDQDLVDRIGEVIKKHRENEGKPLPECETWTGTSKGQTVGAGSCSPINHDGTITLVVAPGGTVTGSVTSTAAPYTCGPAQLPGATGTYALTGTKTDDEIVLTSPLYDATLAISGKRASGTTDLTGGETLTTLTIELKCTDCEDEAAG